MQAIINFIWGIPRFIKDLLITTTILLLLFAIGWEVKEKELFMVECLTERKQYECTALWKSSQPDMIIPIAVPIVVQ